MAVSWWSFWNFGNRKISALENRCDGIQKKLEEVADGLGNRLAKLEKIERIAGNVARERAARPRNWTQFRALAEGAEEPNARRSG